MSRRPKRGKLRLVDTHATPSVWWEVPLDPCYRASFRQRCLASTTLAGLVLIGGMTAPSLANPTGGNVVAGSATISQPSSAVTTVTQQSDRAIINWNSFSIGAGERTQFYQPNSSAFTLNRVTGGDPSVIAGRLNANGNIAIVNRSGILFSKGAQVDVNSLIATTADIHNDDFMAGKFNFNIPSANPNATVVNEGQITIGDHGLAALVAPGVGNSGVIQAKLGKVVLGGAETFAVDFYGDGLISFDVGSKVTQAPLGPDGKPMPLVSNTGEIDADGGTILLTADAVDNIVSNLVQAGGVLRAQTAGTTTGNIILDGGASAGGTVLVTGAIDASGKAAGQAGGTVSVLGDWVGVMSGAAIDASGDAGGGTVLVGGNFHGAGPQQNASSTLMQQGALINVDAKTLGDGGKVAVWSNNATAVYGTITARGGATGGSGGFIETSSHGLLDVAGVTIDASAARGAAGTWLLDPTAVTIDTATTSAGFGSPLTSPIADGTATDTTADLNTADLKTVLDGATGTGGTDVVVTATDSITVATPLQWATAHALSLQAGTGITIGANVTATAGSLDLQAANGAVTQSAGTVINVQTLTGSSSGDTSLTGANLVTNLGAFGAGGNFSFTNAQSLVATGKWSGGGTLTVTTTLPGSNLTAGKR